MLVENSLVVLTASREALLITVKRHPQYLGLQRARQWASEPS